MPRVIVTRDPAGAGSLNAVSIWPPGVTPTLKGRSSMWLGREVGDAPPICMSYAQWLWASGGIEIERGGAETVDCTILITTPEARQGCTAKETVDGDCATA